ncbi:MAG TPA: DnaJ C-terminal domain-containing protein [Arenimonas sp.]|uniref:DnaJ C-terminal domain-containing protein n=1 Tax=Arenimonas sp. TaxID=1872635 RepID=UPI002D7ECFAE|nr:DnaJ C-terminal domain-containing protein [Arenimonas sp.]HEU0152959.1 DnaJ C-terminal domain-containing protein [Arenimonas sp.]
MQFKDYYDTLGVEATAGEAEIKTAYRRLARKYHPDVSKEAGAEERFKAVNEAYEVLRDKDKRAEYDQLRAQGYRPGEEFRPPPGFGGGGFGGGGFRYEQDFGGGGGFSDFFESLFGGGRGPRQQAPQGDVRAQLAISLEQAYTGGKQRISVDGRTLEVNVPAGIAPGQVIRLAGQGRRGGPRPSDLLLEIDYRPHAQFEVDGRNVLYTLPLAPWQAALGATLSVPTLGGAVELRIPPDSDTGRKLRLRGRGLPGKPAAGDQIVELEVRAPKASTDAQKALYQQMADAFDFDPRKA